MTSHFSFENSHCDDYVSEKFFKVLSSDIVPLVLGKGNYSKMAPARSFIDVQKYKSPRSLARYLKYLDQNETAYAEYFEWKRYFSVSFYTAVFCQMCQALNDPKVPAKTYPDLDQWWLEGSHCLNKGTFPWSKYIDRS